MHTLATISTDTYIGLATGAAVFVSILFQRRAEWWAKRSRNRIERDLATNTDVTRKVERQVNGATTAQLKLIAALSRELAKLTKRPKDIGRAELAEQHAKEHERQMREAEKRSREYDEDQEKDSK